MAKWDFTIVGNELIKQLDISLNDSKARSQSFIKPSFDLGTDQIVLNDSGVYKSAVIFTQIGLIGGVAPTNLKNAFDLLVALVLNFSSASDGFSKPIIWNGGVITVPTGYTGSVLNLSRQSLASYNLVGGNLTINPADADNGDILLLTSN